MALGAILKKSGLCCKWKGKGPEVFSRRLTRSYFICEDSVISRGEGPQGSRDTSEQAKLQKCSFGQDENGESGGKCTALDVLEAKERAN